MIDGVKGGGKEVGSGDGDGHRGIYSHINVLCKFMCIYPFMHTCVCACVCLALSLIHNPVWVIFH